MFEFELKRKAIHFAGGFGFIAAVYFDLVNHLILLGVILLGSVACLIAKRYKFPTLIWFLGKFERKRNIKVWPGKSVIFFLMGVFFVTLLFEKDIAIASMLILTLGDGISPLFGMKHGIIKHPFSNKKFIEGNLIGAMAGFFGVVLFSLWGYINISVIEALLASGIAMMVEGIELKFHMDLRDDNIIVPLVAGGVIWLMRLV